MEDHHFRRAAPVGCCRPAGKEGYLKKDNLNLVELWHESEGEGENESVNKIDWQSCAIN